MNRSAPAPARLAILLLLIITATMPLARSDEPIPLYEGLGTFHRSITTSSEAAQHYFDQGMMLAYAFGRREAVQSFRAALEEDPGCAVCSWGEAWALGPYFNEKMKDEAVEAYEAAQKALELAGGASEVERALIEAMAVRYAEDPGTADRDALDRTYADAMQEMAGRFPDDLDVLALFGESMMVLHPWDFYTAGEVRPEIVEAIAALETVPAEDLHHSGACHLYIHAVEASTAPERAEACADVLADGIPGGSHIQHMPSHIYMRIGRYADSVRANQMAHIVDQMAEAGEAVAIYPGHNLHMLWYAAWMDGQSAIALQAARDMGGSHHSSGSEYTLMLARFGRWHELLGMEKVSGDSLDVGIFQFALGLATLRTEDSAKARRALKRLTKIRDATDPEESWEATTDGPYDLLQIAHGILAGEIAAAGGDVAGAIRHLKEAIASEDGLEYSEPEIWPIPARQVLGAILLEAGLPEEAQQIYEEELEDHTENGWSLFGLARSLEAQGKDEEAAAVEERFRTAWSRADVLLHSSRF